MDSGRQDSALGYILPPGAPNSFPVSSCPYPSSCPLLALPCMPSPLSCPCTTRLSPPRLSSHPLLVSPLLHVPLPALRSCHSLLEWTKKAPKPSGIAGLQVVDVPESLGETRRCQRLVNLHSVATLAVRGFGADRSRTEQVMIKARLCSAPSLPRAAL
eukprot:766851-Hanusia_phi.AAC.4